MNSSSFFRNFVFLLLFSLWFKEEVNAQNQDFIENYYQNFKIQSENNPVEKIHLHLDKNSYYTGDEIWFKAYVVIGDLHQPSALSGVLYVELLDPNDSIVSRRILPIQNGVSNGNFSIPLTEEIGIFRIRAYTRWIQKEGTKFYDKLFIVKQPPEKSSNSLEYTQKVRNDYLSRAKLISPDISFIPEGGNLVYGIRSKVGFQVKNWKRMGEKKIGYVVDSDNKFIADLQLQHEGMGQFYFRPEKSKKYKVKFRSISDSIINPIFPSIQDTGFVMAVEMTQDSLKLRLRVNQSYLKASLNHKFYLFAHNEGKIFWETTEILDHLLFLNTFPLDQFGTGAVKFDLLNENGDLLNQRTVFINHNDPLELKLVKPLNHCPGEKVILDFQALNNNQDSTNGTYSLVVAKLPADSLSQKFEQTLYSDLILESELEESVFYSNYYFENHSKETQDNLDLLMLTSGSKLAWKNFNPKTNREIKNQPEKFLHFSGQIKTKKEEPVPFGKIKATSTSDNFILDTICDQQGRFSFNNIDLTDSTILILIGKRNDGKDNVKIILDPDYEIPPVLKRQEDNFSDFIPINLKKSTEVFLKPNSRINSRNSINLKEIKVKANRVKIDKRLLSENFKSSKNLNGPGNADEIFFGEDLFSYPNLSTALSLKSSSIYIDRSGIIFNRRPNGSITGPKKPMAVFIDGGQVSADQISFLNPTEVYSVEVLTSISNLSIYGAREGALIITLKHGAFPTEAKERPTNILVTRFNGFSKAKEFKDYKNTLNSKSQMDSTKTTFWNPNLTKAKNGHYMTEFFNSTIKGTYQIVLDGINEDGKITSQRYTYSVY